MEAKDVLDVISYIVIAVSGGYIASNPILTKLAKRKKNHPTSSDKKEKTAILLGYQNPVERVRLYFLQIGPTAYHFSRKGEIEIIDKAKGKDLERVLADSSYDNIVIYGHGTTESWYDADNQRVEYSELNTSPKKRILQLTCGYGNGKSLVEMCAENSGESFYSVKNRNSFQNYFHGMRLLLSEAFHGRS